MPNKRNATFARAKNIYARAADTEFAPLMSEQKLVELNRKEVPKRGQIKDNDNETPGIYWGIQLSTDDDGFLAPPLSENIAAYTNYHQLRYQSDDLQALETAREVINSVVTPEITDDFLAGTMLAGIRAHGSVKDRGLYLVVRIDPRSLGRNGATRDGNQGKYHSAVRAKLRQMYDERLGLEADASWGRPTDAMPHLNDPQLVWNYKPTPINQSWREADTEKKAEKAILDHGLHQDVFIAYYGAHLMREMQTKGQWDNEKVTTILLRGLPQYTTPVAEYLAKQGVGGASAEKLMQWAEVQPDEEMAITMKGNYLSDAGSQLAPQVLTSWFVYLLSRKHIEKLPLLNTYDWAPLIPLVERLLQRRVNEAEAVPSLWRAADGAEPGYLAYEDGMKMTAEQLGTMYLPKVLQVYSLKGNQIRTMSVPESFCKKLVARRSWSKMPLPPTTVPFPMGIRGRWIDANEYVPELRAVVRPLRHVLQKEEMPLEECEIEWQKAFGEFPVSWRHQQRLKFMSIMPGVRGLYDLSPFVLLDKDASHLGATFAAKGIWWCWMPLDQEMRGNVAGPRITDMSEKEFAEKLTHQALQVWDNTYTSTLSGNTILESASTSNEATFSVKMKPGRTQNFRLITLMFTGIGIRDGREGSSGLRTEDARRYFRIFFETGLRPRGFVPTHYMPGYVHTAECRTAEAVQTWAKKLSLSEILSAPVEFSSFIQFGDVYYTFLRMILPHTEHPSGGRLCTVEEAEELAKELLEDLNLELTDRPEALQTVVPPHVEVLRWFLVAKSDPNTGQLEMRRNPRNGAPEVEAPNVEIHSWLSDPSRAELKGLVEEDWRKPISRGSALAHYLKSRLPNARLNKDDKNGGGVVALELFEGLGYALVRGCDGTNGVKSDPRRGFYVRYEIVQWPTIEEWKLLDTDVKTMPEFERGFRATEVR